TPITGMPEVSASRTTWPSNDSTNLAARSSAPSGPTTAAPSMKTKVWTKIGEKDMARLHYRTRTQVPRNVPACNSVKVRKRPRQCRAKASTAFLNGSRRQRFNANDVHDCHFFVAIDDWPILPRSWHANQHEAVPHHEEF